jgi:ketosteroid isomerase-like protein
MSQENVEIVRACSEAINRGDVDAWLKHCALDCEFDLSRAVGPVHGTYGRDQFRQACEEFYGPWESYRAELDELIDAGEIIVASVTGYFRGRDGMEVRTQTAFVLTIRDGAIAHVCFYQDRQDALEAAGLTD